MGALGGLWLLYKYVLSLYMLNSTRVLWEQILGAGVGLGDVGRTGVKQLGLSPDSITK